jgi:rubrerythrin
MTDSMAQMVQGVHEAMQAEVDGYHFYMMAAHSISDAQGREIFEQLAQEEMEHVRFLKTQYASLVERGAPDATATLPKPHELSGTSPIFSAAIKDRLGEAHYEMSALSIGVQLELSAIQFYSAQAEAASEPVVADFFRELAAWEKGHHDALSRQLQSLRDDYWSGGGFSPF